MNLKAFGKNMMYTTKIDNISKGIAVIGGGAAGMMAASTAAELGAAVVLFEKNKTLGRKLRITGKGRCNVTNACQASEFMNNITANGRFLWSALDRFSPDDTMNMFEELGVPLKVERGRRVFPVSDRAGDIAGALVKKCQRSGVQILREKVLDLKAVGGHLWKISTDFAEHFFNYVIICTGGMSYPLTGSDGDGYRFARETGHNIVDPAPSLVPIVCDGKDCSEMQGLSLKNVGLKILRTSDNKTVFEDFGEMMFTHFGITGPMILSASAHIPDIGIGTHRAMIDLKPALDAVKLDTRLLSDFAKYSNRDFANALDDLLPQKMIPVIIRRSGIDPHKKVNAITKQERKFLAEILKGFSISLRGFRPISEAIITRGGIDVKQINPKTMQSKVAEGLYFAGEVIDVDAYTGGFNLQIAFSTGYLAGESAAMSQINDFQENKYENCD